MNQKMIRLFVIEDQATLIVSSLKYHFRPKRDGIIIAGFATSVEEAIKSADPEILGLFVLDLYIPGSLPIDNIRRLKEYFPDKPIAIYTGEKSIAWKNRMIYEGALTYITKDASREDIKVAIQKSAKGEVFYFGEAGLRDQKNTGENSSLEKIDITPLQHEIIWSLFEGKSHQEISDNVNLSRSKMEKILKNLRKSFKVKNNLELINRLTHSGSL
jgi:DNA-binding NarL/FixJ family response regulator